MRCLGSLLLLACSLSAQDRQTVVVELEAAPSATSVPRVTFPHASLEPATAGSDSAKDLSEAARWFTAEIGGRSLRFCFDKPEGALVLGLCYGGGDEPVQGHARSLGGDSMAIDFADVPMGVTKWNLRLVYKGLELQEGAVEPAAHRRGRTVLGGVVREVILVDGDGDGKFDGGEDRWMALRAERARKIQTVRRPETLLLSEPQVPFETDGRALTVENVARDGASLVLVLDRPETDVQEVLRRRYEEVRAEHFLDFEKEKEAFARRMGLDLRRPRAEAPAEWLDVPLSEAKERARKERKPLLACFFTETNPWCYRYDFYTFADREVDALLRRFVLVKVDVEKDPERSYQASGARSVPALRPLTAAGRPIPFTMRHRDDDGKVFDLPEPEQMVQVWQRPEELVVNLRRILEATE